MMVVWRSNLRMCKALLLLARLDFFILQALDHPTHLADVPLHCREPLARVAVSRS